MMYSKNLIGSKMPKIDVFLILCVVWNKSTVLHLLELVSI